MKLRRIPEDFQVDELTAPLTSGGPFALYRLTKTSIGTPEAVQAIVQRWNVHRKRISYGGLKDRHAVTTQYLTIHNGPRKSLQQKSLQLEYMGQTAAAFTAAEITGNRFRLTLRDLTAAAAAQLLLHFATAAQTGIPNYFDDQRFGSLGQSGEWIARSWCRGDWERCSGWRWRIRIPTTRPTNAVRNKSCGITGGNGLNAKRCWNVHTADQSSPICQIR